MGRNGKQINITCVYILFPIVLLNSRSRVKMLSLLSFCTTITRYILRYILEWAIFKNNCLGFCVLASNNKKVKPSTLVRVAFWNRGLSKLSWNHSLCIVRVFTAFFYVSMFFTHAKSIILKGNVVRRHYINFHILSLS